MLLLSLLLHDKRVVSSTTSTYVYFIRSTSTASNVSFSNGNAAPAPAVSTLSSRKATFDHSKLHQQARPYEKSVFIHPFQQQRRHKTISLEVESSDKEKLTTSSTRLDVPLIFIPGMKGTHLSYYHDENKYADKSTVFDGRGSSFKSIDVYVDQLKSYMLKNLQSNFFSGTSLQKSMDSKSTENIEGNETFMFDEESGRNAKEETKQKKRAWLTLSALLNIPPLPDDHPDRSLALPLTYTDGVQDHGHLFPDGIVEHVVELGSAQFFPFYGHITKHLEKMNERYHSPPILSTKKQSPSESDQDAYECRPTAVFPYDWRRPVPELSAQFHEFCESRFPNQPVQIVAHSMGGLISFDAMRKHPDKYKPGGVFVGVPFQTGIQYLQDLHHGYYTELNRCRQFTPPDQFTFSSHWIFFPPDEESVGDLFVDVTNGGDSIQFKPDSSSIGKVDEDASFQPNAVNGENIKVDFHNVDDWEKLEIGIFDPRLDDSINEETKEEYKKHMEVQLQNARHWRENVLLKEIQDEEKLPDLVICATDTIPTVNQILRRRKIEDSDASLENRSTWEYDYISGRSVPGDGRIDYDKAFPEIDINIKKIALQSAHAKQMCWEESGGSLGHILTEVKSQLLSYKDEKRISFTKNSNVVSEKTDITADVTKVDDFNGMFLVS
eukprot:CAMPEP_0203677364 /NCGR_PEP_ID=MMETSP0090-20130426/27927_1 /ASSEMBLY_ACC=CAM_ASM_001088 /TAXON_ID=426623 /ORGANISM="Chaetoceros affinis, Strain CCMP159" /LENGTH=664 /DNA_ID=CAMNT_0050544233 /DNA_START=211 /DNA_END=2209 /DNA_ORIENTATION=+